MQDLFANLPSKPDPASDAPGDAAAPGRRTAARRGGRKQAAAADGARVPGAAAAAGRGETAGPAGDGGTGRPDGYGAHDIEVLEGLDPVRRRPGMFIGGVDDRALHHLAVEVLDNAMDEAIAGHATVIEVEMAADGALTVRDNGRGIPVEPHPKFPDTSTLEIILTRLHSGGKFSGKAYRIAGGLHGVGISVVNALSADLTVEVARERRLWRQRFARGVPLGPLEDAGPVHNRRGTMVTFRPDPEIFADRRLRPDRLVRMARDKSYLFRGVEIRWKADPALVAAFEGVPAAAVFHFPGGLTDFLAAQLDGRAVLTDEPFTGDSALADDLGHVEWAIGWPEEEDGGFCHSFCNTIATPQGGSHESGLRAGLLRGLKSHAERAGARRAAAITADDLWSSGAILLSLFLKDAQFQGQTKERLASAEATRLIEPLVKDRFELWLARDPAAAGRLVDRLIERAEERQRRRQAKDLARKSATRKLRLPGKLVDCTRTDRTGTEVFLVEGDSAGGSAKAARERETQAILPLRGKILNVASASADKLAGNQELADLVQALGCDTRGQCDPARLRYERVIIMTDADVDGAHITSLLLTFFFREMRPVVAQGHLYLAQPPLFRLQRGGRTVFARDEADRDRLLAEVFAGSGKVEVSRFKGLGEMPPAQLRDTTMDPSRRTLLRVGLADGAGGDGGSIVDTTPGWGNDAALVERLMGRKPEGRLSFIQENGRFHEALDI